MKNKSPIFTLLYGKQFKKERKKVIKLKTEVNQ